MAGSIRDVEGVQFIGVGGINERPIPEQVPPEDFYFLQGWRTDQLGELKNFLGKQVITDELRGSRILSIQTFGDYILVQTENNLIRFSNYEIFGGQNFTNNLHPDIYPIPIAEEEAMPQIILRYKLANNTAGAAIAASTFVKVPLNFEARDTGGNCVLNAGGDFTISGPTYPFNCRIKAIVNIESPTAASVANKCQLKLQTIAGTFIDNSLNREIFSSTGALRIQGQLELISYFTVAAAETYELRIWSNQATIFGSAVNAGLEERYAQVEILLEQNALALASYTVATVPSAGSNTGLEIYVTNETGGAIPAFSDGTNWRRVTDRAIIS